MEYTDGGSAEGRGGSDGSLVCSTPTPMIDPRTRPLKPEPSSRVDQPGFDQMAKDQEEKKAGDDQEEEVALPEEVLLHLYGFLDVAGLVACRGVCRRWRAAASLSEAWRRRELHVKSRMHRAIGIQAEEEARVARAVLLGAPCLRALRVDGKGTLLVPPEAVRCVADRLELEYESGRKGRERYTDGAVRLLRRQAALGGAREVKVSVRWCHWRVPLGGLLLALNECGPEAIEYSGFNVSHSGDGNLPPPRSQGTARRLVVDLVTWPGPPVLEFLVASHTATLEELVLVRRSSHGCVPSTAPVALLVAHGGAPRLQRLACTVSPDMAALADACPALRWLELTLHHDDGDYGPACRYLRAVSARLTHLSVQYPGYKVFLFERLPASEDFEMHAVQLLEALSSSSSPPALTSFRVSYLRLTLWERLAAALAHLPRLTELALDADHNNQGDLVPATFLATLEAKLPGLRVLRLGMVLDCDLLYARGGPVLKEVLAQVARSPSLHVLGLVVNCVCGFDDGEDGDASEDEDVAEAAAVVAQTLRSECERWVRWRSLRAKLGPLHLREETLAFNLCGAAHELRCDRLCDLHATTPARWVYLG